MQFVLYSVILTLLYIMLKIGQTIFKILQCAHRKIFKACLAIFQNYKWKDEKSHVFHVEWLYYMKSLF